MYYDKSNFNGVLIILRESHKDEEDWTISSEEIEKKSDKWIGNVLNVNEELDKSLNRKEKITVTKFRNRFAEMLKFIGENGEYSIANIAFTNINLKGGGASVGKDYLEILKNYDFDELINGIENLKYIFTCTEIFEKLRKKWNVTETREFDGIKYGNRQKRTFDYNNIRVYEIYHPSRSPRISSHILK